MRRSLLSAGVAAAIGVLAATGAFEAARPATPGWQEIAWPYPRDGWPPGRAWRCDVATCGAAIEFYVRPKLGFCNCDSGVADDDEVDRVADLDLISERFVPLAPGEAVRVAGMAGRMRGYIVQMPDHAPRPAIGIALSRRCDLMVAVAVGDASGNLTADGIAQRALEMLGSGALAPWIRTAMAGS